MATRVARWQDSICDSHTSQGRIKYFLISVAIKYGNCTFGPIAMTISDCFDVDMGVFDRIQEAMAHKGLIPADLSRLTGITPDRISKWFSGTGKLPIDQAARIASALDVSIEWIATGRETSIILDDYISLDERNVLRFFQQSGLTWQQAVEAMAREKFKGEKIPDTTTSSQPKLIPAPSQVTKKGESA